MDDVQVLDIDGERNGKNISMGKGTLMGREKQLVSQHLRSGIDDGAS